MAIPDQEDDDQLEERIRQYLKINEKLLSRISGVVFKSWVARTVLMAYTGVEWAHDVLAFFMNRFKPKEFNSLVMVFGKKTQEYTDRVLECIAEIRGVDPSQVLTDEWIVIRVRTGIEFGLPQFYAALQVGVKLILEELLERLNAYTGVNETKDRQNQTLQVLSKKITMRQIWRHVEIIIPLTIINIKDIQT